MPDVYIEPIIEVFFEFVGFGRIDGEPGMDRFGGCPSRAEVESHFAGNPSCYEWVTFQVFQIEGSKEWSPVPGSCCCNGISNSLVNLDVSGRYSSGKANANAG